MNDGTQLSLGFADDYATVQTDNAKIFSSIFNKSNGLSPIKRIPTEEEIKAMEARQLNILRKHMIGKNAMVETILNAEFERKATLIEKGKLTFKDKLSIEEFFAKKVILKRYAREFKFENESENSIDVVMLIPDNLATKRDIKSKFNTDYVYGDTYLSKKEAFINHKMYCDSVTISDPIKKDTLIPDRNLVEITISFKRFPERSKLEVPENAIGIELVEDVALKALGHKLIIADNFEFAAYDGTELSLRCLDERYERNGVFFATSATRSKLMSVVRENRMDLNDNIVSDFYHIYSDLDCDDGFSYIKIIKANKIPE